MEEETVPDVEVEEIYRENDAYGENGEENSGADSYAED